jgi:glycosyltransferase involved in cell wall biosynthesis
MHVGIDARELGARPTGVGRLLDRVLAEWREDPDAQRHRFTLYSPHADAPTPLPNGVIAHVPGGGGTWWEQGALAAALRRDKPDVFLAPGYSLPILSGVPSVVVMHDVSFVAHPEWFRWREGARRRVLARLAASRARLLLTISEFSRDEIVRHLPIPADRVRVVPLAVGLSPLAAATPREPLVLFVGSIFNRRHVPVLLDAFARVISTITTARLEIVGDDRTYPPERIDQRLASSPAAKSTRWRAWVSDDELTQLYARASAFVFLSEYEGFGLTPLEALASGVPPVVLDTAVAREVLGPAALFVPRPTPEDVAAAIVTALDTNGADRARVLAAAPATLGRYRWSKTASATLRVLEEAARR